MSKELIAAIVDNNLARVKDVVDKGADVNALDVYGRTPLTLAVQLQHVGIVRYLCSLRQTDVNAVDADEDTALDLSTIDDGVVWVDGAVNDDRIPLILCRAGALVNKIDLTWIDPGFHRLIKQQQVRSVIFALVSAHKIKRLGEKAPITILKEKGIFMKLLKTLNG